MEAVKLSENFLAEKDLHCHQVCLASHNRKISYYDEHIIGLAAS